MRLSVFSRLLGIRLLGMLALGAITLGTVTALAATAEQPDPPPYYAIQNVTVATGTGETHHQATILIADGLIEAIGPGLDIPGDAWVIDGTDLTAYPGLIDAMTNLGQAQEESSGRGGRGAGGGTGGPPGSGTPSAPQIRGPEDRPKTTPWVVVADDLTTDDSRLANWREAGFTSVLSAPGDGFFAGQASLINLTDGEPQDMVVVASVAHRLNWGSRGRGRSRGFPGSLMGQLSYVKQVFSDARHQARAHQLYSESPQGLTRPAYDRALEPINRAIDAGTPFLMPAQLSRHIDRALDIARQYDLRPILYGAHGAYDSLQALEESDAAVLLSLDWPEEDKDRDPEADTSLRTLYHRRMAPVSAKLLHEAGIPFAFYSDGLSSPSKAMENLRQAIDAGLPGDAALKALTLGAARILGVDDRLGSLETGKIANLVLATAEPWAEDAEIKAVFVDGHKYQERESSEETEEPASDVSGTWALSMETPRGNREMTLEVEMAEDGKVQGDLRGERGDSPLEKGRMSGDRLTFNVTRAGGPPNRGPRNMEVSYTFTVADNKVDGKMSAGPMSFDLSGERTSEVKAGDRGKDDTPAVSLEELERAMARYFGPAPGHPGALAPDLLAITHAKVYTVSGETLSDGTVLIENGKIKAVGNDVQVPKKAHVIDAEGGSLIPGIIDAHSHTAIEGGGNEGSLAVSSMVTIQDVINPDDISIYRALAGGVTTINVLHGSANPIGGGNAVLKLRWGQDADGMRLTGAPPGIKFALGENPKRSRGVGRGPQRYPATRMGVMDVIRQAFREAREYQKAQRDHETAAKAGKKAMAPRVDFKLEPLVEILEGKRLVHAHSYRADEILQLLRLAEEFGFRIATLQHVLEGYKVADEIAAHGAGASTFSDWWGYKVEANDAIPHNAALMTERGVVVSINSDSDEEMRHLNQEAAKTMKWGGLDEIEALKLVTLNPARQLRIDGRVGSIEVGKDADLVLYDGHPLSMFSVVQKTFIDGTLYFDRESDRQRQAIIEDIKARLNPEKGEGKAGEDNKEGDTEPATRADLAARHPGHHNDPIWTEPAYSCQENH